MKNVAIVGVGLIGASFGLALRKAGFTGAIVGVSSARSIRKPSPGAPSIAALLWKKRPAPPI